MPAWLVYVLHQSGARAAGGGRCARVYIGATVNLARRLRQHNGELVGGARVTSRAVRAGGTWSVAATVRGFPSAHHALSFESCLRLEKRHRTCTRLPPLQRAVEAARALICKPGARWGTALQLDVVTVVNGQR